MRRWYRILNRLGGIRVAAKSVRNAALVGSVGVALKSHSPPPSSSSGHRIIPVHYETNEELQVQTDHKLSKRELRFLTFASVEYDDVIYMTPMDFLDSLTLDAPRALVGSVGVALKSHSPPPSSSSGHRIIPVHYETNEELQVQTDHKLSKRELRFLTFASVEYDDVIYMTPMDFLDSLTLDAPRERIYRRILKKEDVDAMLAKTPLLCEGNKNFMRKLDQNGIISFAEYIFLLTLLTKSQQGFRIAFTMFDKDGNGRIEKNEFLLVRSLVSALRSTRSADKYKEDCRLDSADLQYLIKRFGLRLRNSESIHFEKSDEEVRQQDTTILLHLFGPHGNNTLTFDQFQIFYTNLQKEIMDIEFHEFSRGKDEISPVDFARLILRYSMVRREDYAKYIKRVRERSKPGDKGITLEQFEKFSLFLNNLEEFTAAVRLYATAEIPVSQREFIRAVRASTSYELDEHLVCLIYRIFDTNNDNRLSYSEFIAVMNDRLHRGLKSYAKSNSVGWQPFKRCVISELSRF
uniref:EF-hand domain-containing protein n=1 Tax=Ascaris lumbricoides TaxID=6252 RepID=A0A9J2PYK2_ASCLU